MRVFDSINEVKDNSRFYLDIKVPTHKEPIISLCTLAAMNLGTIKNLNQMRDPLHRIVRGLDTLLTYQDYPVLAARNGTMRYRPLGVGVINLAYYFAKHGVQYGDEQCLKLVHETFESFQYFLLEGSVQMAKELGPCPGFEDTKYAQGILPIDTYSKSLDKLVKCEYKRDWDKLRAMILKYGLRNCTLSAMMPAETSAWISNATNGIEPIKELLAIKGNKENVVPILAPDVQKLKKNYEISWDVETQNYLKVVAVIQKFIDQSLSANTTYNPQNYDENKIPIDVLIEDILFAAKHGVKTLYYANTYDGNKQEDKSDKEVQEQQDSENAKESFIQIDDGCASGACAI